MVFQLRLHQATLLLQPDLYNLKWSDNDESLCDTRAKACSESPWLCEIAILQEKENGDYQLSTTQCIELTMAEEGRPSAQYSEELRTVLPIYIPYIRMRHGGVMTTFSKMATAQGRSWPRHLFAAQCGGIWQGDDSTEARI